MLLRRKHHYPENKENWSSKKKVSIHKFLGGFKPKVKWLLKQRIIDSFLFFFLLFSFIFFLFYSFYYTIFFYYFSFFSLFSLCDHRRKWRCIRERDRERSASNLSYGRPSCRRVPRVILRAGINGPLHVGQFANRISSSCLRKAWEMRESNRQTLIR